MKRFPDWPQRLRRAIEDRRRRAYQYGAHDCALCAADLVHAQTGQDFAAAFRGRYSDEAGGMAVLASLGHADLPSLVDTLLTRREGRVQRGDVLWHPGARGPYLGLAWNGGIVAPGPTQLLLQPVRTPLIVWGVA